MNPKSRPNPEHDPTLRPKTIAVIGASAKTPALGRLAQQSLVRYGFHLDAVVINPFPASERAGDCQAASARKRLRVDH